MKSQRKSISGAVAGVLVLAALVGRGQAGTYAEATPGRGGDDRSAVVLLDRAGQPRIEGTLLLEPGGRLKLVPRDGRLSGPTTLEPGAIVSLPASAPQVTAIPPLFRVQVGETARISGMLRAVTDKAVLLSVPWQAADVAVTRPGVQAVLQRPGEARLFADRFDRLEPARWSVRGKPQPAESLAPAHAGKGLRLPAGEASLEHRLAEPVGSGRVELAFLDEGRTAAGQRWTFELTFRGPAGPATLCVLLGWAEESLAVECPSGPTLAVQRLAHSAGWHRLSLRFGPEHTEIAVDGKELAHGRAPAGPLDSVKIATGKAGANPTPPSADLAGYLGEIQIIRFAEPPTSLEVDPSQDEVRLVVGDQLYGQVHQADHDRVTIDIEEKSVALDWSEVAGIHFRRVPATSPIVAGALARLEWHAVPGEPRDGRDLDFAEGAVTAISDTAITLATPYAGTLVIPRDRLVRLRVLDRGWLRVIDSAAHHLGDNISTTPPLLDPPLPEGGVLERTFVLDEARPGNQAFVVLDVVQVVGESSGLPYSNLVQKGELRTYVAVNGRRIDYLNRYINTSNETPERIRIPIPRDLLKTGKNLLRIEQTGIASDPTWFDDLGILQVAIQFSNPETTAPDGPAGSGAKP